MILFWYHDTSWLPKIGRLREVSTSETICNPKDNLVRMIRTMFGIGTIRKYMASVLEMEVKLSLPNLSGAYDTKSMMYPTISLNMPRFCSDVVFSDEIRS